MNNRKVIIASIILGALAVGFYWWRSSEKATEREFAALFAKNGDSHIAKLTIAGPQRSIAVTEPGTLASLEEAFRNPSSGPLTLGLSYGAVIEFRSGHEFNIFLYVHSDKGGVTIANPAVTHAGDPEMTVVRFTQPVNPKIGDLMNSLMK